MAILTVVLHKVTSIADGDALGTTDPYVKFELEQDNMLFDKDFGDKISSKKKNERDPVYDETFEWEIPSTMGLNNLVLSCKIMDDDLLLDDKIGSCKINLEELDLESEFLGVDRVVDNNWFSKDARLWLKIAYKS